MYTKDYFLRYVNSPGDAVSDLKRGYSFAQYQFFPSRKAARESDLVEFGGYDPADIVAFRRDTAAGRVTVYGFRLAGLCGFGPFESADEALEVARSQRGYNGCEWPYVAVYEGRYVGQTDVADGDLFKPTALVAVERL